ncbi:S4 domain-containing protein [Hymenobacter cellulosilyticus]|uniref:S4 domain-containing protein n=1 Tax=Hymenobacter cellulosilyticus TaxID=2932248 RepID=UPI0028806343|nr:S4 domain-containing protein [Hymenobacter cellulosilyticus]
MPSSDTTRLNKYISESGVCSRREADKFIEQGTVFVNGKRATIGAQVSSKDKVVVNGNLIEPRAPKTPSTLPSTSPRASPAPPKPASRTTSSATSSTVSGSSPSAASTKTPRA